MIRNSHKIIVGSREMVSKSNSLKTLIKIQIQINDINDGKNMYNTPTLLLRVTIVLQLPPLLSSLQLIIIIIIMDKDCNVRADRCSNHVYSQRQRRFSMYAHSSNRSY